MADAFFDPTKGPVYDYSKMKPRPPARYLDTDRVAVHPVVRALANPDGSWPHRYSPSVAIRMVEEGEGHVGRTSERYGRSLQDYGFDKAAEEYFDTSWRPGVWAKRSARLAALSASKRPAPNPYNPAQPAVNPLTRPFASAQDPRRNQPWSIVGTVAQGLVDAQWPVGLTTRSAHPQSQMFHPFTPVGPEVDAMNPITARRRMRSPYIMTGMMQPPGFVFPQPPAVGEEVGGLESRANAAALLGLSAPTAPQSVAPTTTPRRPVQQLPRGRLVDPARYDEHAGFPLPDIRDIASPDYSVTDPRPQSLGPVMLRSSSTAPIGTLGVLGRNAPASNPIAKRASPSDAEARYLIGSGLQYGGGSRSGAVAGMLAGLGPVAGLLAGSPFTMAQDLGPELNAETLRRELRQQNPGVAGDDVEGGIYRRTMDKYLRRVLAGTSDPAVRQRLQSNLDDLRKEQDVYGPPTESRQDQLDRAMSDTAQHLEDLLSWIDTERPLQNQKAGDLRASMMGVPEFDRSYFAQEHPDFLKLTPEQRRAIMMDAQRRGTHGDAILNRRPVPSQEELAQYRSRNPNADMNPVRNRAHLSGGALSPDSPYVTGGQNTPSGLLPGSIDATPRGWYERYQRDQALAQLDANDERLQAPGGHDEFYLNRTRAMLDGSETETDAYKGTLRYADDPMQSRRKTYGMQSERFVGPGNSAGTYGTNRLGALRALNQAGRLEYNTDLQDELRRLEGAAEASAQAKRDSLPARKAAAAERVAAKKNKTLERRNRAALVRAVNAGVLPATALAANPISSSAGSSPSALSMAAPNTAQNQQDRAAIRSNLVTGVRDDGTPLSPFLHAVSQNRDVDAEDPTSVLSSAHSYMVESGTDVAESDVLDLWTYMRAATDNGYWLDQRYKSEAAKYQGGPEFFRVLQDLRQTDNLTSQQKSVFARRINSLRDKSKREIERNRYQYQDAPMYPTFN